MKKFLCIILAAFLCFSLCACRDTLSPEAPSTAEGTPESTAKNETTESETTTEEVPREPADEKFLKELYGSWDGSRWGEFAPFKVVTLNEDGTCIVDEKAYTWQAFKESENSASIEISEDENVIFIGRISLLEAEGTSWYEIKFGSNDASGAEMPFPGYSKIEETQEEEAPKKEGSAKKEQTEE